MTKLESYQIGGAFTATQFYADIEGHPNAPSVKFAMEELRFSPHKYAFEGYKVRQSVMHSTKFRI